MPLFLQGLFCCFWFAKILRYRHYTIRTDITICELEIKKYNFKDFWCDFFVLTETITLNLLW